MYLGQSQNFMVEYALGNSRHIISDLPLSLDWFSVPLQSLSFLQRKLLICLRSLFRYFAKHAKSKHFPVFLALVEYGENDERSVDGRITGGGRFCRLSFGKGK